MKIELINKIKVLASECVKAQRDSERWNMKCMNLPPRVGIRGGRNTTIQAKASIIAKYRDDKMHQLRLAMSEFIKEY